ncbi:histidine kinase [Arcobacter suis]|uniref:histidine kinase n=1 Tax=Arcobacter suis CECT 7833 TaxID=663365 RepID=A0AAD0WR22_9BACT|nr:ABC transporter substrate-binding protein [Arcobacter suis]AXX90345.1 BvgS-like domain-containing signal transduction sensor histidine kinase (NMT1 domain) [Arcobacter suis CECT 7833]RWS46873.1 histidine kinase [Arcobacter suis]
MSYSKRIRTIFILIILLSHTLFAKELKKVTLQLSWLDQFQFAGYYMAKQKGFYEELGLDVEIKPFAFGIDIPKEVNDGKIDFAVGRETLILERIKNPNIVALYAIFQSTPLVLLSTKESGINNINDFSNKKIMTTIDDASEVSLKAMISSNKIKLENLTFLKHSHNIDDLINKNTDVISAYISKAPYTLQKKGVEYNIFDPKKYDFDMYSDMLYTNQNLISYDLNTVLLFKKASLKGWEYAYSNMQESVDVIYEKYNTQNLEKEELLYEAKELKKLSYFKTANLGEIRKDKIQRIYDLYNVMGLVPSAVNLDKFIFDINSLSSFTFSPDEIKYIEEKDTIKMCVMPNSMPYSDIKDGKFVGFVADYISIIENKIKKPITLVPTKSWTESLAFAKARKCDILSSIVETKERENEFNFTKSYIDIPFVLLTKSGTSFINNLSSIKNKKVSIVEDYAMMDILKNKYKNLEFVTIKNIDEGLEKVLSGETFGHIDAISTAWYKLQTKYLTQLSVSAKLDEVSKVSIAVRNDDNVLFEIFQKSVLSIDDFLKDEILNKWVSIEYKKEFDYSILWKIFFVLSVIFIAVIYKQKLLRDVNNSLKEKVEEKTKELREVNNELEIRIKKEVEDNLKKDRLLSQQQKMVSMGQMIENIAHQWRQPLSLITTGVSGIKLKKQLNDLDDDFFYKTLDSILNTSKYLSNTIDDFRYFFKPQKEKENFYLEKCCRKTIDLMNPNFSNKDIQITYKIENIQVCGYETELIQVLINILNNSKDALEFLNENEKFIFIDIFREDNKAVIEIKDNAGGIEEEIIDKVFEPYFTTKHQTQGTGIGLFMCKEIINKHMNGQINIINTSFEDKNKIYKGTLTRIILEDIIKND